MTATRRMIRLLREQSRMDIDNDLEELILKEYATEPDPYTYTEQDLHEQIRKLIIRYHQDHNEADSGERSRKDLRGCS